MANDSSNDVSTAPLQPLVFQCRSCRLAVGDSVNFDCSVRSLACVALTGASGLTVDPHPQATVLPSTSGKDDDGNRSAAAVAFVSLSCSGCGASLGKRFGERGLPPRLERIAGLFCLEVDSISSYELGKPEMVAAVAEKQQQQQQRRAAAGGATTAATTPGNGGKDSSLALSSLASRVAELEEELVKVQNVVLGHNEALARLQQQGQQGQQRR